MTSKDSKRVLDTMQGVATGRWLDEELQFDPNTGELLVVKVGTRVDDDRVPATVMAREGFFAGATLP